MKTPAVALEARAEAMVREVGVKKKDYSFLEEREREK